MPGKEIDQVVSSKLMYLLAGNSLPVSDVRCPNINIITLLYIKALISKESNKMRIYYSYRCRDTWTEYFYNETIDLSGLRSGLSILSLP